MDKTNELIARTERLVQQMEGLQDSITQLQAELRAHNQDLAAYLGQRKKTQQLKPVTNRERRSAPRRKGNPIPVQISHSHAEEDLVEGWVIDRSAGGLRLLVDDPIDPGSALNIRPVKAHEGFPWIEVRVKNCYPERKSWSLGCQFVHKLSWDDLQHFG